MGLQGGVSVLPQDIGNGNEAVTEGSEGLLLSQRLLYRIADSVAIGIAIESEDHRIQNTSPVPLTFGHSRTLSNMAVVEFYPPLWPIFASSALSRQPIFPYGLIGVGQNKNFFTESLAFVSNCNPNSACKVALKNTLAVKVAVGVDYFIMPNFSINAEIGWKLNSGTSRISTQNDEHPIISNDGYKANTASFVMGMRYFFEKPKQHPSAPPKEEPAPEPPIEVLPPPPLQDIKWVTKTILFETSSWEISDDGKALLLEIAHDLTQSPQTPIQIEGHTDLHGISRGNMRISQKRAQAVIEWLLDAGVTNSLQGIAYGDNRPIRNDETPEADQANRRVVIRRGTPSF